MIRSLGFDPWRAYAIPPTPLEPISIWLLKVAISLQRGVIFRQVAFKLPSSCHLVGYVGPSCLQDGSRTPQHRNLTPTWTQLGPTWPHLRLTLIAKMSILCRRGCIFQLFADMRLKMSKVTSRWPREAPRWPQDDPKNSKGNPKTAPGGAKMAPRWPQDGPKTTPRRLQVASKSQSKTM